MLQHSTWRGKPASSGWLAFQTASATPKVKTVISHTKIRHTNNFVFIFCTGQRLGVKLQLPWLQKAVLKSTVRIWARFLDAAAWTRWSEQWFWKEWVNTATSGKRHLFLITRSCGLPSLLKLVVKRGYMIALWLLLVCSRLSCHAHFSLRKTIIPKADIVWLLRGLCFFTVSNVCIQTVCNWSACVDIWPAMILKQVCVLLWVYGCQCKLGHGA